MDVVAETSEDAETVLSVFEGQRKDLIHLMGLWIGRHVVSSGTTPDSYDLILEAADLLGNMATTPLSYTVLDSVLYNNPTGGSPGGSPGDSPGDSSDDGRGSTGSGSSSGGSGGSSTSGSSTGGSSGPGDSSSETSNQIGKAIDGLKESIDNILLRITSKNGSESEPQDNSVYLVIGVLIAIIGLAYAVTKSQKLAKLLANLGFKLKNPPKTLKELFEWISDEISIGDTLRDPEDLIGIIFTILAILDILGFITNEKIGLIIASISITYTAIKYVGDYYNWW